MKVVIVAKTRMGRGACIGGITFGGKSVRLIAPDAQFNEQFNQEYEVGDVWDVEYTADPAIIPPHVENIIVHNRKKLPPIDNIEAFIEKQMPPECGGVDCPKAKLGGHASRRTANVSSGHAASPPSAR